MQLLISEDGNDGEPFPYPFWKTGCPTKTIIFEWLMYRNRNLIWENLQKWNWHGPAICPLCRNDSENNMHLFFTCSQAQLIWQNLACHFGFMPRSFPSIAEAFKSWCSMKKEWRTISILTIWSIWKWRNDMIFNSKKDTNIFVVVSIISLYNVLDIAGTHRNRKERGQKATANREGIGMSPTTSTTTSSPCACFDGAAQHGICSCGVYIKIAGDQAIEIYWNAGPGSNNRAEAVALAGLLSFCNFLDILFLQIYGDSRIIIDHVLSKHNIKIYILQDHWKGLQLYGNTRRLIRSHTLTGAETKKQMHYPKRD